MRQTHAALVGRFSPTQSPYVKTQRIHIVGASPRTGTTLLAEAMRTCFDVDAWEDHEARLHRSSAPPGARVYLTKRPGDILRVGPRLRVDPDFHVVYLVRDPRDVVTSRHRSAPDRYWAGLKFWTTYTSEARRLADHPRFTTVRYEDFTADPDRTQRQLARTMPFLRVVAPFSQYHEVAKVSEGSLDALGSVRPITPASVGSWRDHLPRVKGQLQIHGPITADLVEHGYEPDGSWEDELEGVEPDLSPGRWPEHFAASDLAGMRRGRRRQAVKAVLRRVGLSFYRP